MELKARRKTVEELVGKKYAAKKKIKRGYYLRLTLPSPVDAERAKAKLEDGLLRITLPKKGGKGFKINVE
ncbi:MAG TPA: Hsp20 family protein [Candidatus Korarchaeota archaeon]|nr:Hsp20 family protein [Candidatus Korarchaeota archaeon]